jgi:hypothetical protein
MAYYRAFEHVLRLDPSKSDVNNFLNGTVYIFSKTDGTNFSAWADEYGNIHCGSRHREITLEHDNADSMLFFTTEPMFEKLRQWLIEHPQYIIYGEFIGGLAGRKMVGTIKEYLHKGMMLFAVYDIVASKYLPYSVYKEMLKDVYDQVVEPLVVLKNPSLQEVEKYIENHYNLPEDHFAEGIVCWNYDFKDMFNHFQIAKIVNAESKVGKGRVKTKNLPVDNVEQLIVDSYVTDADCEKAIQKACVKFNLENWVVDRRTMGFYLNTLFSDLLEEEMGSIVKKFKMPTIQFGLLRQLVFKKGRAYLGLV